MSNLLPEQSDPAVSQHREALQVTSPPESFSRLLDDGVIGFCEMQKLLEDLLSGMRKGLTDPAISSHALPLSPSNRVLLSFYTRFKTLRGCIKSTTTGAFKLFLAVAKELFDLRPPAGMQLAKQATIHRRFERLFEDRKDGGITWTPNIRSELNIDVFFEEIPVLITTAATTTTAPAQAALDSPLEDPIPVDNGSEPFDVYDDSISEPIQPTTVRRNLGENVLQEIPVNTTEAPSFALRPRSASGNKLLGTLIGFSVDDDNKENINRAQKRKISALQTKVDREREASASKDKKIKSLEIEVQRNKQKLRTQGRVYQDLIESSQNGSIAVNGSALATTSQPPQRVATQRVVSRLHPMQQQMQELEQKFNQLTRENMSLQQENSRLKSALERKNSAMSAHRKKLKSAKDNYRYNKKKKLEHKGQLEETRNPQTIGPDGSYKPEVRDLFCRLVTQFNVSLASAGTVVGAAVETFCKPTKVVRLPSATTASRITHEKGHEAHAIIALRSAKAIIAGQKFGLSHDGTGMKGQDILSVALLIPNAEGETTTHHLGNRRVCNKTSATAVATFQKLLDQLNICLRRLQEAGIEGYEHVSFSLEDVVLFMSDHAAAAMSGVEKEVNKRVKYGSSQPQQTAGAGGNLLESSSAAGTNTTQDATQEETHALNDAQPQYFAIYLGCSQHKYDNIMKYGANMMHQVGWTNISEKNVEFEQPLGCVSMPNKYNVAVGDELEDPVDKGINSGAIRLIVLCSLAWCCPPSHIDKNNDRDIFKAFVTVHLKDPVHKNAATALLSLQEVAKARFHDRFKWAAALYYGKDLILKFLNHLTEARGGESKLGNMQKNIINGFNDEATMVELAVMAVMWFHWCLPSLDLKGVIKDEGWNALGAEKIYTHQVAVLKALMEDPTPLFSLDLTVPLAGPEFASRMAKFKETVSKGKINLPGAAMEKVANDFANGTTSQKYILTELAKSAAMGMLEKTQVFCKDQLEGGRYHTNTLARVFTPEQLQGWCIPTDPTNDNSERFLGTGKQYMRRNAAANLDTASLHTTLKQAYLSDLFNDSTLTQEELDACRQVGRSFSEEDAKKTKAGAEMEIAAQKIEEQESYKK